MVELYFDGRGEKAQFIIASEFSFLSSIRAQKSLITIVWRYLQKCSDKRGFKTADHEEFEINLQMR